MTEYSARVLEKSAMMPTSLLGLPMMANQSKTSHTRRQMQNSVVLLGPFSFVGSMRGSGMLPSSVSDMNMLLKDSGFGSPSVRAMASPSW